MNKIYFARNWFGHKDRKKAWSGTPYGVYKALEKKLEVIDCPLDFTPFQYKILKLHNDLQFVRKRWDIELGRIKIETYKLKKYKISKEYPSLLFDDLFHKNVCNSYVYQDLSFSFLIDRKNTEEEKYLINSYRGIYTTSTKKDLLNRKKYLNKFYKKCKGIFTMSKWLKDYLVEENKLPADKVHHIGAACNMDVSKIDLSNKRGNKFLYVGKAWRLKNGPLVVETFRLLQKKYPNIELYIIGPEESHSELEGIKNLYFLGALPYEEVVEYYNKCDYFVMPSRCEAYGMVYVESLIFGLPCIGTNKYAGPEFITHGETGYLLNDRDSVDELYGYMENLYLNGSKMAKTVQSKRDYYIKEYSWDAVADRIIEVLKKDGYYK